MGRLTHPLITSVMFTAIVIIGLLWSSLGWIDQGWWERTLGTYARVGVLVFGFVTILTCFANLRPYPGLASTAKQILLALYLGLLGGLIWLPAFVLVVYFLPENLKQQTTSA